MIAIRYDAIGENGRIGYAEETMDFKENSQKMKKR